MNALGNPAAEVASGESDRARLEAIAALLTPSTHDTTCSTNYRRDFSWNDCQCWQASVRSRLPADLRPNLRVIS